LAALVLVVAGMRREPAAGLLPILDLAGSTLLSREGLDAAYTTGSGENPEEWVWRDSETFGAAEARAWPAVKAMPRPTARPRLVAAAT
jgi:hypothetical protein